MSEVPTQATPAEGDVNRLPSGIKRKLKSRVEHLREKHKDERRSKHMELREKTDEFTEHEQGRTLFEHLEGSNTYEQKKAREEAEEQGNNEPIETTQILPPLVEEPNRCIAFLTNRFGLRHGVVLHGIGHSKRNSKREKVARFIHGQYFQVLVVVLLLLDVCLVIAELILQSYQECEFRIEPERCEEPPAGAFPLIEEEFENANGFFPPTGCGAFADAKMPHNIHRAEVILMWFSRAILIFFTAEILTTLICLGKRFFTILYLLDFFVVVTSLILSFIFESNTEAEAETAVLIFLRCWRFARVLHGFGVTIHTAEVRHERTVIQRIKAKSAQEKLEEGRSSSGSSSGSSNSGGEEEEEEEEELDTRTASSPTMEKDYLDKVVGLHPVHKKGIQDLLQQRALHQKELEELCQQLQLENDKLHAELAKLRGQ